MENSLIEISHLTESHTCGTLSANPEVVYSALKIRASLFSQISAKTHALIETGEPSVSGESFLATPLRGQPLPVRETPYVRVVYPRPEQPCQVISVSSNVVGVLMHWGANNSYPCIKEYTTCPWCKDGLRKLWYGWLIGADQIRKGRVLLQLTEGAVRNNPYLADPAEDLRGARIDLTRVKDGKASYVRAVVKMNYARVDLQRDEPDVIRELYGFYKLTPFLDRAPFNAEEGEA